MAARRVVRSAIQMVCFMAAGFAGSMAMAGGLMSVGGYTSQPIGHYEFCKTYPHECAIRSRDKGPLVMTAAWRATIEQVNLAVNREVRPMNDIDIYGKEEHWAYPVSGVGDCEDYVLEKRRRLHALGIPLSNLLITVVRKPDGEGHAVLTVRTTEGDLILDNLSDEVKLWSWTSYEFLKRQAATHTGRWVSLQDANNLLVGAVRN
ncbi:transglutaminase-like cysteine peptidase [Chelativorans composti]|jgi:Predicted periplasmic protein|uniref:Transglutaminase-like cysteine peptidase n=1 Tax=Chelativorans composti TaxID=768533 RepID=A0ABW5DIK3_9HYPH|nr:transglutaminase-like cysteine peptidase [bacterium SGD-2]